MDKDMKRIVPKIRFPGFADDWEQRKLSQCAGFRRGSFPQPYGNKEWYGGEGAMPFVQVADVADDMKLVDDTKQKISKLAQPMSVYADKGSVLVTLQGSIGRVAITQYGAFVDRTVLIFDKYNQDIDKTFWAYIIKEKFIDEARKAPGGTIKTITKEALSDFDLMLPNYDEQKKLGAFLVSIDNLITLHQHKLEKIKEYKRALLQKMFPKEGSRVPEIRFPGFTGDWEQCKFSEGVSEIGDGLHGTPTYCDDGNVFFVNGNNLVDGKIVIGAETKAVDESQQSTADKSLDDTTILMSINGTIGNLAYYSGEKLMLGKSAAYIKVSEFDKRFVYAYLQAPSVHNYFMDSLTGTTIKNLGLKAIREMKMLVPQNVEEQKRIGEYFDNLDNLITLHQHKLEEMKKYKKGLLQQMFV